MNAPALYGKIRSHFARLLLELFSVMQLILELFEFLSDPRVQIRNTATKYVAGLTGQADNRDLFKLNDFKAVHDLAKLIDQDPVYLLYSVDCS